MKIIEGDTEHRLCRHSMVIKNRALKTRIRRCIFNDHRLTRFYHETLNARPALNTDSGNIRRPHMEHRIEPVRFLVEKPDRPRRAVKFLQYDLKAP